MREETVNIIAGSLILLLLVCCCGYAFAFPDTTLDILNGLGKAATEKPVPSEPDPASQSEQITPLCLQYDNYDILVWSYSYTVHTHMNYSTWYEFVRMTAEEASTYKFLCEEKQ